MATKKAKRGVSRKKVKLWFAKQPEGSYSQYEVHPSQPRITKDKNSYYGTYLKSKGRGSRYDSGSITELCPQEVSKALGLNLREGEAVEVTFTFGKVVTL